MDLQAIIEQFDLDGRDAKLFRAVVAYLEGREGREARRKGGDWDKTPKGDDHWREFRARVFRLIKQNLILAWGDLDQDLWFRTEGCMNQPVQWHRALDQHLLPNRPRGPDGLHLRAFQTKKKGIRYLTQDRWLHCALRVALKAEGRQGPAVLRHLRERYHATEACEVDSLRYGGVEDNLQSPVTVINSEEEASPGDELNDAARGGPSNEEDLR